MIGIMCAMEVELKRLKAVIRRLIPPAERERKDHRTTQLWF